MKEHLWVLTCTESGTNYTWEVFTSPFYDEVLHQYRRYSGKNTGRYYRIFAA